MKLKELTFVGLAVLLCVALIAEGQPRPAFSDATRIAQALNGGAAQRRAMDWMEANLTQEQIDSLEAAIFPEPPDEEKLSRLRAARRSLLNAGLASNHAVLVEVGMAIKDLEDVLEPVVLEP